MPRNLELKIKLKTHTKIEEILNSIGAEYKGTLKQKDTYYKYKKGLLKLRIADGKNELIKYERDETGKKRWSDYEILLLEGKNVEKYLASLFTIEAVVEKQRGLYIFENSRVHLDKVKKLGNFLEIETVVINDLKDAEKRFKKIISILDLNMAEQIKTSYRFLVTNK